MIKAVDELRERLVSWKARFQDNTIEVAKRNEAAIIDLVTDEQLSAGVDSTGKQITPRYTPYTVRIKKSKGQEHRFVTLHDTGDYYRSLKLKFGGQPSVLFEVYATDRKAAKLEGKYGDEILGLTAQSVEKLNDLIRDELIKKIQDDF